MPNPNYERGAASKRNLKRTAGPGRPKQTADEKEIRRISRGLLSSPKYRRTLKSKLEDGSLHPSVQVMLYYYAFGKPTEIIETKLPVAVRIVNKFDNGDDE